MRSTNLKIVNTDSSPRILTFQEAKLWHLCGMPLQAKRISGDGTYLEWKLITNKIWFTRKYNSNKHDFAYRLAPEDTDVQGS